MAVRNVSIRLAIDGENEFRAAIQKINNELKVMNSALKLTEQEYKNNQNSMEALTAKHKALTDAQQKLQEKVKATADALKNAQDAQKRYADIQEDLSQKLKAVNDALEKNAKAHDLTEDEVSQLTEEQKRLNEALQQNQKYLEASTRGAQVWEEKLNTAKTQLLKTNQELMKTDDYLDEAKNSADGCATSIDKFGKEVKQAGDDSATFGKNSKDAVDMLSSALAAAGIGIALREIRDAMLDCVQASMEFESAFAGVKKTVDATPEQLKVLSDQIIDMSTRMPATTTEIAAVAEAAGQLGIKTEDIANFTEVMLMLGTSTNMSSDEAATALARLANIVQMPASQYQNLGSTVVDLGNNFATTEADIVHMMTRMAASGNLVGMSAADIAGIATALSSVGIEAEAGGSAISKAFKNIETEVALGGEKLEQYAYVAGMSAKEFSAAWERDAAGALATFIEGLGTLEERGGNAIVTLNDMELKEIRLSNALLSLAKAGDLTRRAIDTANSAWKDNTALVKEASQRYETTESKVQMAKNAFQNLKKTIGDEVTPAIQNLAEGGKDAMIIVSEFLQAHPGIVTGISAIVTGIGGFVGTIALATAATKVFSAVAGLVTGAFAGPLGWIALAVGATTAIAALALTINNEAIPSVEELSEKARALPEIMEESTAKYEEQKTNIEATANIARDYIARLKELESQGTLTNEQQREYADIVERLRTFMPELNITIDEQTGLIQGGTDAILAQVDAWEQLSLKQAAQDNYQTKLDAYNQALVEQQENTIRLDKLKEEGLVLEQKIIDKRREAREAVNALTDEQKDLWAWGGSDEAIEKAKALTDELNSLEQQQRNNEATQKNLTQAIEDGAQAVSDAADVLDVAKQAVEAFSDEQSAAASSADEWKAKQAAALGAVKESLEKLADNYAQAYEAAKTSLDGQTGLFGSFKTTVDESLNSIDKMTEKLKQQAEDIREYGENLKKAAEYGIDDGLVKSLADGSPQSAALLKTIVDELERLGASAEKIPPDAAQKVKDLNNALSDLEKVKGDGAAWMAAIVSDVQKGLSQIEDAAKEFKLDGVLDVIKEAFSAKGIDFSELGKTLGGGFEKAFNSALGAESPARQAASSAMEGYIGEIKTKAQEQAASFSEVGSEMTSQVAQGVESGKPEVEASVQSMGEAAKAAGESALGEAGTAAAEAYGEAVSGPEGISAKTDQAVSEVAAKAGDYQSQMVAVGEAIPEGVAQGMRNGMPKVQAAADEISAIAMNTMQSALQVNSPSKRAITLFEYVGEGAAIGLRNKIKEVEAASNDLSSAAFGQRIDNAMSQFGSKIQSSVAAVPTPANATSAVGKTTEIYGGINVNVTPQNGESPESFGSRTARQIRRELRDKGVNF